MAGIGIAKKGLGILGKKRKTLTADKGALRISEINKKLKIIDIGHSNLSLENSQSILETTISQTAFEGHIRAIKVVTGHGSGKLRESVRTWCKEQEGRFQAVIHGEDYNMFNNCLLYTSDAADE